MILGYPTSDMILRSKGQRSTSQGHKVQKHIEGDRVVGVSLHLYRDPILESSYYYYYYYWVIYPVNTTSAGLARTCQTFINAVTRGVDNVSDDAGQLPGWRQDEQVRLRWPGHYAAHQRQIGVETDAHRNQ